MLELLRALVLALWWASGVPATPEAVRIAGALSQAVLDDAEAPPVLGSHVEDLAAMAEWTRLESGVHADPRPFSWDARAGVSCGILQERCEYVRAHGLVDQAREWLRLAHRGAVLCPESPLAPLSGGCRGARKLADGRVERERELLGALLSEQRGGHRVPDDGVSLVVRVHPVGDE